MAVIIQTYELRWNMSHQRQFYLKVELFRLYEQTLLGYEFPLLCLLKATPETVHWFFNVAFH